MGRLIIDGNTVYEIDEECMRGKGRNGSSGKAGQEGSTSTMKQNTMQENITQKDTRTSRGGAASESNKGRKPFCF